ncbi:MAG: cupredoxin domain-containing protein [Patescibacteria group bacterium]
MKNLHNQSGSAVVWSVIVLAVLVGGAYLIWGKGDEVVDDYASPTPTMSASPSPTVSASSSASPTGSVVSVKTFTVLGAPYTFTPAQIKVKKGDTVKIIFKNTAGTHDWKLDEFGAATGTVPAGQEKTIQFVASKTGTFEYYCSIGNHRQLGMKGTLVVE